MNKHRLKIAQNRPPFLPALIFKPNLATLHDEAQIIADFQGCQAGSIMFIDRIPEPEIVIMQRTVNPESDFAD